MYARLVLTLLFGLLLTLPSVAEPQETVPAGWTHRPVMEHFTSLGCPPLHVWILYKSIRAGPRVEIDMGGVE